MLFHKQLLDIIDYAYSQAHDSEICVCPSAVPDWDDRHLTDDMAERQLTALREIRKYVEECCTRIVITTSYIPEEDITIVWQELLVNDEYVQKSLVGWYHGEPDESSTKQYSYMPLTAQYLL